jgi:S1-C subfamily serine protease
MIPGLTIRTNDGDEHKVVSAWLDPDSDLAVVFIDGTFDEPALVLDATPLMVGDEVRVIGTPWDEVLFNCVLPGCVVKIDMEMTCEGNEYVNLDVMDCHAAPGCSGGPIVDAEGRVRGVLVISYAPLMAAVPVEELD